MKKAGCHTVYIGFESVNPESLEDMKKKQTVAELIRAVKVFRRSRIHIHGMFVLGFDQDDWGTIRKTVRWAKRARLTSTQFLILTPLPGLGLLRPDEGREAARASTTGPSTTPITPSSSRPASPCPTCRKPRCFGHRKFYSLKQKVRKLLAGQWLAVAIAHYARNLNRTWKKRNRTFLRVAALLKPRPGSRAKVSVDYHEDISLE